MVGIIENCTYLFHRKYKHDMPKSVIGALIISLEGRTLIIEKVRFQTLNIF